MLTVSALWSTIPQAENLWIACITPLISVFPGSIRSQYPTLRKIAWDYLAIQGLATALECAISGGGITRSSQRNQLQTDIFEALRLLKSAYQNGHVAATTQAAFHTEDFIRLLDNSDEKMTTVHRSLDKAEGLGGGNMDNDNA